MNKLLKIQAFLVLITALVVGAIIGCSEKGPGGSAPQIDGNLVINIERSPSEVMGLVEFYILTVSGPDMEPVTDTAIVATGGFVVFDVQVPIGERRLFVLEGVRGGATNAPQVIYRGQTVAPVRAGAITTLNLFMRPVVPMVRLSPVQVILAPGEPLELQLEIYNIQNLSGISIDFRWPWQVLGDNVMVELSERQSPDVRFSWGHEGGWMGITIADTLGGTIVNEQGNGILANMRFQPLTQVVSEGSSGFPDTLYVDTVWNYTMLGETPNPSQVFYEHSEFLVLPVLDRIVEFPDAVLLAEVRRRTGVQAPLPIMLSHVTPFSYFSVIDLNVADLTGLENMVNLSSLNVSHNVFEDITPLAQLTRLTNLEAENDGIQDITPLASLTSMKYLILNANWITDLGPLSGMTELATLELNVNQISDIAPLANKDDLYWLYLGNNTITDISVLANLPNLWRLGLSNNTITDILPLVNNPGISSGDLVELWGNAALANDPIQQEYVAALRARGVTVYMSQPVK